MRLQVPDNFTLLAFCTQSWQSFRSPNKGQFILPGQRLLSRYVRAFFLFSLSCALFIVSSSCVKLPRHTFQASGQTAPPVAPAEDVKALLININTASPEELEKLPGIGRGLAARIVAHRKDYGRFRRPEHVMMVRGISDRRFRAMRALITSAE